MGNPFEDSGDGDEISLDTIDDAVLQDSSEEISLEAIEEGGESRDDKKRKRYQDQYDGRVQAEARVAALTEELTRANQRPVPQLAPTVPQENTYDVQLDKLHDDRTALFDTYNTKRANGGLTPEEEKEFSNKARKLEIQQQTLVVEKVNAAQKPEVVNPQHLAIQARHADVFSNPRAHAWATAKYNMEMAAGTAPSMEVMDDAMDGARKQFEMAPGAFSRTVDPKRQSRYRGDSAGGGAPSGDTPRTIRMTDETRSMADTLYSHIPDEKERRRKWAREVGPDFLKAERQAGR